MKKKKRSRKSNPPPPKKKKKAKKKQKTRLPVSADGLKQIGVRMTAARHIYQALLAEIESFAPGMKRMLKQLSDAIDCLKESETVITDYGKEFHGDMEWPKTVAYWRTDLCRHK